MALAGVPRCLTIAASDSGGGAGVQADLRAFAAAGCYGASVITAVTAQNTVGISRIHRVPVPVVQAQLTAVLDDIRVDAVKTGVLGTASIVEVVADCLSTSTAPLVVDPVITSSSGTALTGRTAVRALVRLLLPRATVVTPNLTEAELLAGTTGSRRELAERIVRRGARAVLITGGHGEAVDHLFDGRRHVAIAVARHPVQATHGSGCTHSASLAAALARGAGLEEAARCAAAVAGDAVRHGLTDLGAGEGPVDVLNLAARR